MIRILTFTFLVAFAISTTAAPVENDGIVSAPEFQLEDAQEQGNSDNACVDFYSFKCNKQHNHQPKYKEHLAEFYSSKVYDALIDTLNAEITNEKDPINVERKLFQSCMQLGSSSDADENDVDYNNVDSNDVNENNVDSDVNEQSENNEDENDTDFTTESIFHGMMEQFGQEIPEEDWKELDQKLALLGFKHAFFEIDVVKDSGSPNKNIIRLSPPSMREWNFKKLTDVVSDIFTKQQIYALDHCKGNDDDQDNQGGDDVAEPDYENAFLESDEAKDESEGENEGENEVDKSANEETEDDATGEAKSAMCEDVLKNENSITEMIVRDSDSKVMDLLNNVLKGIFDTMDTSNREIKNKRVKIVDWNKTYNSYAKKKIAKIDWIHILKSYFENLEVSVEETDYVLVENVPYFKEMAKFLGRYTNEQIAHTIRSKFVAENARYYDWDWVYEMNPVHKSSFCLEQNKFYAASAEVLRGLKSQMVNTYNFTKKPYMKAIEWLVYEITDSLHTNISNSKLSRNRKNYLLSNLKDLTKDPLGIRSDPETENSIISEYYIGLEITGNYLVDVHTYNMMSRERNLRMLNESSSSLHRSSPFSILDTENPRNRFIINLALDAIIYKNKFLHLDADLFGTFGVKTVSFLYSLLKESPLENGLRDFHGILSIIPRISYTPVQVSCFIKENIVNYAYPVDYDIITEVFSVRFAYEASLKSLLGISAEKFFAAYTEDHCRENDGKTIKKVLSNVQEFSTAFQCSRDQHSACKLQAF